MLERAFEWYRIVNAKPAASTIDSRKAAASDLVAQLSLQNERQLLLSAVQGVVSGFDHGFTQDAPVVRTTVQLIRSHDSAFPQDLTENALELRACVAIAVGELLTRTKGDAVDGDGVVVALLLRSALENRPPPKGKFLSAMLKELLAGANDLLTAVGRARRGREDAALSRLETLADSAEDAEGHEGNKAKGEAAEDVPSLARAVVEAVREVRDQAEADREELNALWWMFTGFADTANAPLRSLSPEAAALCAGAELADLALLPPSASLVHLAKRAVEEGRDGSTLKPRTSEQLSAGWSQPMLLALAPDEPTVHEIVQQYPALLPLSWLCRRRLDSQGAAKIGKEFELKTGVASGHTCLPTDWAVQVFAERIVQRTWLYRIGN